MSNLWCRGRLRRCASRHGLLDTVKIHMALPSYSKLFQQTRVYPYPLVAGSARPNPKMGAPDPENPLFLGFSVLRGGLRPWSETMVSEGARPWGRGRSGDRDYYLSNLGAKKSTQTFFVQSFSRTLRVMDVRAENRGRPQREVRFSAAPVMRRNFLTQGRPGVRVRSVRGKSGPKSLCLCCLFFPDNQEPRKGGFQKGVFARMYASLGCGALSARSTAAPNILDYFLFPWA